MTVVRTGHELDEKQRERLSALADALIPGGSGLPSARTADVTRTWIDKTLAANPDLAEPVRTVLATVGDPHTALKRLHSREPGLFESFAFAVAGAYFMNPNVRRALGYPGNAPRRVPAFPGEMEYYLEDDILGPVIARGSIYRRPPDEP